jgi:hypothetical protein
MKHLKEFDDVISEKRVTVKRRYTEKHPAKNISTAARVRNSIIEAMGDGVLTEEELTKILQELKAHKRWLSRNTKLFNISEDQNGTKTYGLSPYGKRVKSKTLKINEGLDGVAVGPDLDDFQGMDFNGASAAIPWNEVYDEEDWKNVFKYVSKYKAKLKKFLIHSKQDLENFAKWLSDGSHPISENRGAAGLDEADTVVEIRISEAKQISNYLKSLDMKAGLKSAAGLKFGKGDKIAPLGTVNINPKLTGPLSPIYTQISCQVFVWKNVIDTPNHVGPAIFLRLQYSWEHPSGSNGYTVTLVSTDNGQTFENESKLWRR